MNYVDVPEEMKSTDQWVVWKRQKIKDKFNNVPKTVTGKSASHSDSRTWSSFDRAIKAKRDYNFNGISFALSNGFRGFDFDNVYCQKTKKWHEPSKKLIDLLVQNHAYVEFSPSGTGVHAILLAEDLFDDEQFVELKETITAAKTGFKKYFKDDTGAVIEFYWTHKILTTTGNKLINCNPDFTNGYHKDAIKEVCKDIIDLFQIKKRKKKEFDHVETNLTDHEVLEIASTASNSTKFNDLWAGNWEDYGTSQSSADISLLNMLAFYTGCNFSQMKRLFQQSELYRKQKGESYLEISILNAIEYCNSVYEPQSEKKVTTEAKPVKKLMKNQLPKILTHNLITDADGNEAVEARKANDIAADVMELIEKQDPNKAKIFVKENQLGHIRYSTKSKRIDETYSKKVTSSIFEEFTKDNIKGSLNRIASFYQLRKKQDVVSEVLLSEPPNPVGNDIINHQILDNVPYLNQIINHPIITKDWQIINEPGYHKESQIYLEPSKLVDVQDMDLETAYDILTDWLQDFPFKDYSDFANTIALLITMLIRSALPEGELPPLFIISANSVGAGKSTLAQILSAVITGEAAGSTQLPTNEEEIRKAIGAELILGTEVVVLDNITEQVVVASSSLASAISEPTIRFRILGKSKMIRADNSATYVLTGNNVDANADLTDRACFIRLDTEKRVAERQFKTESILSDTIRDRERLFSAVYTIVRSWIDFGKQRGTAKHRSNVWAKYISGIFDMLDEQVDHEIEKNDGTIIRPLKEFLNNDIEARRKANPEYLDWCSFRDVVNKHITTPSWTVSEVFEYASYRQEYQAEDYNLLGGWFKGSDSTQEGTRRQCLGMYFRSNLDRVFGNYKLVSGEKRGNRNTYRFKDLEPNDELA